MDGVLAINELNSILEQQRNGIKLMAKYGRQFAEAEAKYKTALMQESLRLRDEGMPVTLIDKVVYGRVAKARFDRDSAEILYKTAQENVNVLKLQARILDNQIAREWGQQ